MATARRLGVALSALLGMGHFGDCGHAVVGARTEATDTVTTEGGLRYTVRVDVLAPACAPVEGAVFVRTSDVEVVPIACDGACAWSRDFDIADPYEGNLDVEVTAECGDCDPDTFAVFAEISYP